MVAKMGPAAAAAPTPSVSGPMLVPLQTAMNGGVSAGQKQCGKATNTFL
jgi:hypothetical protein